MTRFATTSWSLLAALAASTAATGCRRRAPVTRPNVLVIAAEGLSVRLGCYGGAARTPHADRLAARGRRFERAYRPYPDAAISRASWTAGSLRPEGGPARVALPALFAAGGYAVEDAVGPDAAEAARDAARRIGRLKDGRAQGRPFLVFASLPAPPPGWLPPADLLGLYSVRDVEPEPAMDPRASAPAIALADWGQPVPPPAAAPAPDQQRRLAVADLAAATYLDAQVGVILGALDDAGLWETTVVVLVGEAPASGTAGLRPDLLREDALRVPLIVSAPGLPRPGRAASAPVALTDVRPTLADLAGLADASDGRSLRPLLDAPGARWTEPALSAVRRTADPLGRSLRTERWRYTRWPDGSRELYDHGADPGEHVNLSGRPEHRATIARLAPLMDWAPGPGGSSQQSAISGQPTARADPRARRRLNVLLVVVDDLNTRLGCYGHDVRSPNVDRLARLGRRFDRAYAQFPSCNPSRASFMTGWRPQRTGVWSNLQPPRPQLAGAVPLQERFRAEGYFTARVGKVYHGPFEEQFRWDVAEHTPYPDAADEEEPSARGRGMASWWRPTDNADAEEPDGRAARRVAALIEQAKGRPFFVAAGLNKPHLRWVAPRRYFDLYPASSIRWPAEPEGDAADVPAIAIARRPPSLAGALLPGRLEPEGLRAQAIAAYQACVSFMDARVGVILQALDRARLWDRTVVVFTSDHGHHLGEHGGLWRKNTLFEESLRVPLVIAAPGIARPGEPALRVVELVDLYPTLLELAGLRPAAPLDGASLVPMLRDPGAAVKEAAVSVTERAPPPLGYSLRTDRWRYTLWPDGSEELYDHRGDPRETRNLAAERGRSDEAGELRARLAARIGASKEVNTQLP